MFYTIRGLLNIRGVSPEDTVYRDCKDEMLDFKIVSGDFYEIPNLEEGMLRFKNTANIRSFDQMVEILPELRDTRFATREKFPWCVENLELIRERLRDDPAGVCIEGGPCLFGEHEVTGEILLRDGRLFRFDYSTGKRYTADDSERYDTAGEPEETDFAEFLHARGEEMEDVRFLCGKTGLTEQEYLHVLLPFAFASALNVPLVLTLPDMSYRKYLEYAISTLPAEGAARVIEDFDVILYGISDIYLRLIRRLQTEFGIRKLAVVHNRDREIVNLFETARKPYIERNKVLRHLTDHPARLEPIKDYISMPALPFYIWGAKTILEINSMDETDSYRKCRTAHKGTFDIGCVLFPELLSGDGENTLYCAPIPYKKYKDYASAEVLDQI